MGNSNHGLALTRRRLLTLGAAAGLSGLLPPSRGRAQQAETAVKTLKLAWNPNAVCVSPVAIALQTGIFAKRNLNIEVVNYAGSTEQLLEAIATGKADAGIGMILRWLKPLEQGFDVKLVTGTHGGCTRFLGYKAANVASYADLKGKTIGVNDIGSPAKHTLSIVLGKLGIDPDKDVQWRVYPADLLQLAAEKGEIQAIAHWDPDTYRFLKTGAFTSLGDTNTAEFRDRVCCVVGVRGGLLKDDPASARGLVDALLEAHDIAARSPTEAAEIYSHHYKPKETVESIADQLHAQNHALHPEGEALRRQVAEYTAELKLISVIKSSTDPASFARRVTADLHA